jgi:Abnormal spindle-like microcephaly-assoc'd, ASPM-SPD-2-Hydin
MRQFSNPRGVGRTTIHHCKPRFRMSPTISNSVTSQLPKMYYRHLPPRPTDSQNWRMLFLPRRSARALFSLAICITAIFSQPAIALSETQAVRTPSSPAARVQLTCVATNLQLGEVAVGNTTAKFTTITNRGGTRLIIRSTASTNPEFGVDRLDLPLTLSAGESFTFQATFAPRKVGAAQGIISIISDSPGHTLTIRLAGIGRASGQLRMEPAVIAFGDVDAGTQSTQIGRLTASTASVTISSAHFNSRKFQLGGLSLPVTIPAGHTVPFNVTFISKSIGNTSAILSFVSDAQNSPTKQVMTVRVSGPVRHKVQLSWKPSKSKHVAGYNVYRSNRTGGPYKKINRSLDPSTDYTDRHVVAGCTYYYAARAVNMKGLESKYSRQVQATIPCDHVITDTDRQSEAPSLPTCGICKH